MSFKIMVFCDVTLWALVLSIGVYKEPTLSIFKYKK